MIWIIRSQLVTDASIALMNRRTQLGIALSATTVFGILLFGVGPALRHFAPAAYESCNAKLESIRAAKDSWLLDHEGDTNAIPTDAELVGPGKYFGKKPSCPQGGVYTYGKPGEYPQCSMPMHSLEFGKVTVVDAKGNPVSYATVALQVPKNDPRISVTDSTGESWLTRFPASDADAWKGANITVSKSGFRSGAVRLLTNWPVVVRLERE